MRDAGRAQALSLLIGSSMMGLRLLQERMMKKEGEEARDGVADGVDANGQQEGRCGSEESGCEVRER